MEQPRGFCRDKLMLDLRVTETCTQSEALHLKAITTRFSPRKVSELFDRDDVTLSCGLFNTDDDEGHEEHEADDLLPSPKGKSITKKRRKL